MGIWRDETLSEAPVKRAPRVTVPRGMARRCAYRVTDESLNKLIHRDWFVIYEEGPSDDQKTYSDGDFLVIERHRGGLIERSVRRLRVAL